MTYLVKDVRGAAEAKSLVEIHKCFFHESLYRDMTFDPVRAEQSILSMMMDSDFHVLVAYVDGQPERGPVGFFEFAFENPWMAEEVMLCVNFYVLGQHRRGQCSQMLMDKALEICKYRGAKLVWASSTAGFSDNGCNERAFRMFLKRNRFREVGTFLVWEPGHEQSQKDR
jgi:GNAT superfamily N-acetyltransferase